MQSMACVLHGTATSTVSGVAATTIGPRIVGTVALTNARFASCGFTVNVDQATPVCLTPTMPWMMPERAPVLQVATSAPSQETIQRRLAAQNLPPWVRESLTISARAV